MMDLPRKRTHIGEFNWEQCKQVIRLLQGLGLKEGNHPRLAYHLAEHDAKYGLLQTEDFDPLLDPCWVNIVAGEFAGRRAWCFNLEGPDYPECHGVVCGEVILEGETVSRFIPLADLRNSRA